MVIDLKKCNGCAGCAMACKAASGTPSGMWWSKVLVTEVGKYPNARIFNLPVLCMHCDNPPCVDVCPTGASFKRDDGIVVVDYDKCMGCGYCRVACPYDARCFVKEIEPYFPGRGLTPYEKAMSGKHQAGVAEKCDFCAGRLAQGEEPACVQTCIPGARHFGDLDDPNSEVSRLIADRQGYQLLPELGTNPSVYYLAR
jgi:molybdopterin-containing oxidoreductase family iron-sulfur binding subunit